MRASIISIHLAWRALLRQCRDSSNCSIGLRPAKSPSFPFNFYILNFTFLNWLRLSNPCIPPSFLILNLTFLIVIARVVENVTI